MTTVDNSKIFLEGIYGDATVNVPANTTYSAGLVLARNADNDLKAFSTDNDVAEVEGEKSIGEVTFTGAEGTNVPIGTQVKTAGNVVFETMESRAIATGATTVTVPARAILAGTSGNVDAATITTLVEAIQDVSAVTNAAAFTGGVSRVVSFVSEPTYILAQDLVNGEETEQEYSLVRVFECGAVNKSKINFEKTADASNVTVLDKLKNNGFNLVNVQELT